MDLKPGECSANWRATTKISERSRDGATRRRRIRPADQLSGFDDTLQLLDKQAIRHPMNFKRAAKPNNFLITA